MVASGPPPPPPARPRRRRLDRRGHDPDLGTVPHDRLGAGVPATPGRLVPVRQRPRARRPFRRRRLPVLLDGHDHDGRLRRHRRDRRLAADARPTGGADGLRAPLRQRHLDAADLPGAGSPADVGGPAPDAARAGGRRAATHHRFEHAGRPAPRSVVGDQRDPDGPHDLLADLLLLGCRATVVGRRRRLLVRAGRRRRGPHPSRRPDGRRRAAELAGRLRLRVWRALRAGVLEHRRRAGRLRAGPPSADIGTPDQAGDLRTSRNG